MRPANTDTFFDSCVAEIESEYARLQHRLGWRFLGVPRHVLRQSAEIAFISLNPGGDYEPPAHPRASCEVGNWYTTESWANSRPGASRLQEQVRLMFRCISEETRFGADSDELITRSLVANLIPFRSPSYAELHERAESVRFAHGLWKRVLPRVRPSLLICLGRDTEKALLKLLPASLSLGTPSTKSFPTGWGDYTATLHTFCGDAPKTRLLTLPHLSRFTVFTSQQCAEPMKTVMRAACVGL